MGNFANIMLIPTEELPQGQVSAIRNAVIQELLAVASRKLNVSPGELVVRDLRPVEDLALYSVGTTAATINNWLFTTAATTATGYVTVTGDATMADQRFVALYGARDMRRGHGPTAVVAATDTAIGPQTVSLIKISLGGGERVVWDMSKCAVYTETCAGVSPTPVMIPERVLYNISYYKSQALASAPVYITLEGVVVEPKGKVLSP